MKCVWEYKGTKQTGRFSKEKCCVFLIIFSPEKTSPWIYVLKCNIKVMH